MGCKMAVNRDIEGPIHRSIIAYLKQVLPGAVIHHGANEFGMSGPLIARQIAKNKFNGMLVGWPDIIVLPDAEIGPIFFEVKAPKGNPTKQQWELLMRLSDLGYKTGIVDSIEDVAAYLEEWSIETMGKGNG